MTLAGTQVEADGPACALCKRTSKLTICEGINAFDRNFGAPIVVIWGGLKNKCHHVVSSRNGHARAKANLAKQHDGKEACLGYRGGKMAAHVAAMAQRDFDDVFGIRMSKDGYVLLPLRSISILKPVLLNVLKRDWRLEKTLREQIELTSPECPNAVIAFLPFEKIALGEDAATDKFTQDVSVLSRRVEENPEQLAGSAFMTKETFAAFLLAAESGSQETKEQIEALSARAIHLEIDVKKLQTKSDQTKLALQRLSVDFSLLSQNRSIDEAKIQEHDEILKHLQDTLLEMQNKAEECAKLAATMELFGKEHEKTASLLHELSAAASHNQKGLKDVETLARTNAAAIIALRAHADRHDGEISELQKALATLQKASNRLEEISQSAAEAPTPSWLQDAQVQLDRATVAAAAAAAGDDAFLSPNGSGTGKRKHRRTILGELNFDETPNPNSQPANSQPPHTGAKFAPSPVRSAPIELSGGAATMEAPPDPPTPLPAATEQALNIESLRAMLVERDEADKKRDTELKAELAELKAEKARTILVQLVAIGTICATVLAFLFSKVAML